MPEALDVVCLPGGSECGLAFVGCVEFGSRCAMGNSQPFEGPSSRTAIKKRGWGQAVPGDDRPGGAKPTGPAGASRYRQQMLFVCHARFQHGDQ